MADAKWWSILIGGVLLFFGLLAALRAARNAARAMGPAATGRTSLTEEEDNPALQRRVQAHASADWWFNIGVVLTALGIGLQTWGSLP
jgi:hypothetical protein